MGRFVIIAPFPHKLARTLGTLISNRLEFSAVWTQGLEVVERNATFTTIFSILQHFAVKWREMARHVEWL